MFLPNAQNHYSVSPLWWFYFPLILFFGLMTLNFCAPDFYTHIIDGELGVLENFHSIVIGIAFCVSLPLLKHSLKSGQKWLSAWVGVASVACLYIFLEEISYGQHFVGWEASEFWQNINDQNETNLHNTSSWLDQKPRLLLEIGVITGGMIIPLLKKYKPSILPEQFNVIYPSGALFIIALLAEIVHLSDMLIAHKIVIFGRSSELQETYYFYFVLLYLIMLRRKLV